MNHGTSYYSSSSTYKHDPYRITENFNVKEPFSLKGVKVVAFEVPIYAVPFTVLCDVPSDPNKSDITILSEKNVEIVDDINARFIDSILTPIRELHKKFGRFTMNLMGYLSLNKYDPIFYKDEMFFYDLYINENWMDYPMFKQLLSKEDVKLPILPEVFVGEYDTQILRTFLDTSSKLNPIYPIESMIVKPYLEPYGQSYRNGVGYFEQEMLKPETPVIIPPKAETTIPISTEKRPPLLKNKEDDEVYEKVKEVFDTFLGEKKEWEERIHATKVNPIKENKMFLFGFIRSTCANYIYIHWDALKSINTFDIKKVEKAVGHYAFEFCKKNFDFYSGEKE